ncbi:hypothetical protein [Aquibacillus rhizosphaerae]|uniref:Uncharacterized protein n=1 Tax=Aquibacillus rhizosphaerae TaxID=3051431 RepID=A0ABT7L2W3_9BACI|nr:hypothetical protein [Aquibacillus sp. LR5S19]MDL4840206.1 hypothetical protein [Aquibacillus sp. LR5S19]
MNQYIFLLREPVGPKEVMIEATGMLDAFNQAKELLSKTMRETSSQIEIQFKGIVY